MDEIQKILVKAGREDLAQKYYKKVAAKDQKDMTPEENMINKEKDMKKK